MNLAYRPLAATVTVLLFLLAPALHAAPPLQTRFLAPFRIEGPIPTPSPFDDDEAAIPSLVLQKEGPAAVHIGDEVVWNIIVTNIGGAPAEAVVIEDFLPESFTSSEDQETLFTIDLLLPGESRAFAVFARATLAGTFSNTAHAIYSGGGPLATTVPITVYPALVVDNQPTTKKRPPIVAQGPSPANRRN